MKKKSKKQRETEEGIRLLILTVGGTSGYALAELALRGQPHPLHWLIAAIIGGLSYGGVALRQRFRKS